MGVRPYKVLLSTCVVNCTAGTPTPRLCSVVQWSVHWAPSRAIRVLVLAGARRCALKTCGEKKMRAPLLGLAKSLYYVIYGCERDYAYCRSSNREQNQTYSSTVSYFKNIIPRNFTTKCKLKLCCTSSGP